MYVNLKYRGLNLWKSIAKIQFNQDQLNSIAILMHVTDILTKLWYFTRFYGIYGILGKIIGSFFFIQR